MEYIGSRLINWHCARVGDRVGRLTGMNGEGLDMKLFCCHDDSVLKGETLCFFLMPQNYENKLFYSIHHTQFGTYIYFNIFRNAYILTKTLKSQDDRNIFL